MASLFPGCITRYSTIITRWSEKSQISYLTFITRQPLDDLLWFWVAHQCGLTGSDGLKQIGWQFAFVVLFAADIMFALILRLTLSARRVFDGGKSRISLAVSVICAVSSGIFCGVFMSHVYYLHRGAGIASNAHWNIILLLTLMKGMRAAAMIAFAFWVIFTPAHEEQMKHYLGFERRNTLACLVVPGFVAKMRSLFFVALMLAVWVLYQGLAGVGSAFVSDVLFLGATALIALLYYCLGLHNICGAAIWSMCEASLVFNKFDQYFPICIFGWGPWCTFECKKSFAFASDICCQADTIDLEIQRRDEATSDVFMPDDAVSASGRYVNTSWGFSLRRSLEAAIEQDLRGSQFGEEIINDDPRAPLYFLTGQPVGFDLTAEDEVWTSHASNTFWSTALAYVDELQCCSQKIELSSCAEADDNVVGMVYLLKVTDTTIYSDENGGGIYHYDGGECPLCLWCPCCQINRGKLLARHNYCCTEYCGDNAPTGVPDAYIFKWGAKDKAGLEIAHAYRIIKPSATKRPAPPRPISRPLQEPMEQV